MTQTFDHRRTPLRDDLAAAHLQGRVAAPRFVSCGGAAMLGAALLNCSHLAPTKPAQLCNFSWSLLQVGNVPQVVSGSFLLPPGANNAQVYQGAGYVAALAGREAPSIPGEHGQWLLLGDEHGPLAWFVLGDRLLEVLRAQCRCRHRSVPRPHARFPVPGAETLTCAQPRCRGGCSPGR